MRTILPSSVDGSIAAGVVQDAVPDLDRQIEASTVALEHLDDPERMLVVAEVTAGMLVQDRVERLLAGVAKGRMTEVVADRDRLRKVLVQSERARDDPADSGRLHRVGQACAEMIAPGCHEDLRLVLQSSKRLRVDDAVAIPLEGRAQAALFLGDGPTTSLE